MPNTEKFDKDVTCNTGLKVSCFNDWLASANGRDLTEVISVKCRKNLLM